MQTNPIKSAMTNCTSIVSVTSKSGMYLDVYDTYIGVKFAIQFHTATDQCMHKPDRGFTFIGLYLEVIAYYLFWQCFVLNQNCSSESI